MNSMKRLLCSELLRPHPACLPQAQPLGTSPALGNPGESGRSSQKETKVGAEEWEGAEPEEVADHEVRKKTNDPFDEHFQCWRCAGPLQAES